jgi:LPS-assembly lipoprotein
MHQSLCKYSFNRINRKNRNCCHNLQDSIPTPHRKQTSGHFAGFASCLATATIMLMLLLSLSGCGFTVRSQASFPPQFSTLYFDSETPYSQFESALKKKLRTAGITFTDDATKAPYILRLSPTLFAQTSDAVGSTSTQARIYHLTMASTFSVSDRKGSIILPPQTVSHTQDLTLNTNEIFDTSTQVDVTKQNMQQILITKVLDILSSRRIFDLVQATPTKK